MDYGGGLENRFSFLRDVGSNPTPSATKHRDATEFLGTLVKLTLLAD